MNTEHKIIFSMYNSISKRVNNPKLSQSLDIEQLLLFMECVFDKIEYKYLIENCKIKILPQSTYKLEYQSLLDQSDVIYIESSILRDQITEGIDSEKYYYERIDEYQSELPQIKERLYFMNIFFNFVNCTCMLPNRENLTYNFMFSIKNGKDFVSCLISMTLKLLLSYQSGGCEEAIKVIQAINLSYDKMKNFYNDRNRILSDMQHRNWNQRQTYRKDFFINQSYIFNEWIENHKQINDIFEFMFYKNNVLKSYAIHFMQHIIKISQIIMKHKRILLQWEGEYGLYNISVSLDFKNLDRMLEILEKNYADSEFNVSIWIGEYIKELYKWVEINNFS